MFCLERTGEGGVGVVAKTWLLEPLEKLENSQMETIARAMKLRGGVRERGPEYRVVPTGRAGVSAGTSYYAYIEKSLVSVSRPAHQVLIYARDRLPASLLPPQGAFDTGYRNWIQLLPIAALLTGVEGKVRGGGRLPPPLGDVCIQRNK